MWLPPTLCRSGTTVSLLESTNEALVSFSPETYGFAMTKTRYSKSEETQVRILDAAKALFAKQGYDATSTRQITTQANVRNASVNYYFATKRDLAVAVIDRRFDVLQRVRAAALAEIETAHLTPLEAITQIVSAFVVPLATLSKTDSEGWLNYNRIMAQVAASGQWLEEDYVQKINCTAMDFVNAIATAIPTASPENVMRAYTVMLGTVLFAFSKGDRTLDQKTEQSDQTKTSDDPEFLVTFLSHGLIAILGDKSDVPYGKSGKNF